MNTADFLIANQVQFQRIPHRDTYQAQHLAAAIHVPGRMVAKTVLLRAKDEHGYVVAVLPANKLIDLEQASNLMGGGKVELATEVEIARHCPDCEFRVLPPFGSQYALKTIVDSALATEEEIVFEGSTHHDAIRMKFADYERLEKPLRGSFAK